MQTLKLIPKQVSVTATQLFVHIGTVSSTDFDLGYHVQSDSGAIVQRGSLKVPIASIDVFNEKPLDPAKVNAAIGAALGIEVDPTQPLSFDDMQRAKRKRTQEQIAALKNKKTNPPDENKK